VAAAFTLSIASRAVVEVTTIARWWTKNRPLAPRLFQQELDAALLAIAKQPESAPRLPLRQYLDARAYVLQRTGYLVLYDLDVTARSITVMRVRHGKRRPLARRPTKRR
jgi:plasmid stabilization system protein ParE